MEISTVEDLIINSGLYRAIPIKGENYQKIIELANFNDTIKFHCPKCADSSIFKRSKKMRPMLPSDNAGNFSHIPISNMINRPQEDVVSEFFSGTQFIELRFECAKDTEHIIAFHFTITNKKLVKTGQFPALADYESKELDQYKKVISKTKLSEFRKSVGLFSHGVGIGAFVYLRRIFEDEIHRAFDVSDSKDNVKKEDFNKLRMNEKIVLLKNDLPSFLSENKNIYGILSTGIHELHEDECLKYFPTLKLSIELILSEKKEKYERELKMKQAKSELSKISSELNGNSN